jgi:hypothetical protein
MAQIGRPRRRSPPPAFAALAVKVEPVRASLTQTLTARRGAGFWYASRVADESRPSGRFRSAT